MLNCNAHFSQCHNVAPDISLCNATANEKTVLYNYKTCSEDSLAYARHENQVECFCINNPITDCRADLFYDKCTSIFMIVLMVQAIIILLGVILNLLVCYTFCRRECARKKISNILLVNQSIADLVNCIGYALPTLILFFILTISKTIQPVKIFRREYRHSLILVCEVMAFVSISSSVMIYAVMAFERWMAFAKPMWHRTKLRKRHIWRAIMILWLVSISSSILVVFVDDTLYIIYFRTMKAVMVLIMAIVTILFSVTFYKARKAIRGQLEVRRDLNHAKKEFHLTKVFILMYLLFLLTFIPLAVTKPNEKNPLRRIKFIFFTLTAMMNPILTMTIKRDFNLRLTAPTIRICGNTNVRQEDVCLNSRTDSDTRETLL